MSRRDNRAPPTLRQKHHVVEAVRAGGSWVELGGEWPSSDNIAGKTGPTRVGHRVLKLEAVFLAGQRAPPDRNASWPALGSNHNRDRLVHGAEADNIGSEFFEFRLGEEL